MAGIRRGYLRLEHGLVHLRYGGRGAPLIVLHDAGQSSATAERHNLLAQLGDRFRVYAPDLPGHGRTDPWPVPPTLADLADFVRAVAHEMGDPSVRVLGIGLGALIGAQLAGSAPHAVEALVCAFPPAFPREQWSIDSDGERLRRNFAHWHARLADQPNGLAEATSLTVEEAEAGAHGAQAAELSRAADRRRLFGKLERSTLLMATLGDPQFDLLNDLADGNPRLELALAPPGPLFGAFEPATFRATVEDVLW
ncbi:MAG: alpha/beta fold hydrolase [Chloroflexota bacterium]|nr:alpha/beta fold hydrolase [Dehalococcoidia bacterium]MDW8253923.1 alpha/beta fold hydrolase [Chloroflexota bacterium]